MILCLFKYKKKYIKNKNKKRTEAENLFAFCDGGDESGEENKNTQD